MSRFPRSLRWRLQVWYGAMLVAVLGGFGFTAFHLERAQQLRKIDDGLHERVSVLVTALRAAPDRGADKKRAPDLRLTPAQAALFDESAGYYFAIWMQNLEPILVSPRAPGGIPKPESREAVVRMRQDLREAFLFAAPVDCVLVGRSIAEEQADLRRLAALLTMVGLVVLAAGLLGGWWLATRAIRPVEDIGATAARIAAGDLSQRIAIAGMDSELGRLGAVLNSTFARLETAFAQQARFTADAAHELRTPVAVMLTQTQSALARERPAVEYRETLEACQRATQRMRRLIESLLALARLDAGREERCRAPCDLSRISAESLEFLRPLAAARKIEIHTDLATANCQGDAEQLAQVVTNLLSNAIEYNHDGGEVWITTESRDDNATLIVRNTGPGISAEDLPHIFERFHRADKSRTSSSHTGLGLAICQAIIQTHDGSIAVASGGGDGATFTVQLPSS